MFSLHFSLHLQYSTLGEECVCMCVCRTISEPAMEKQDLLQKALNYCTMRWR